MIKRIIYPMILYGWAMQSFKIYDDDSSMNLILEFNSKNDNVITLSEIKSSILNYCNKNQLKLKKGVLKEFINNIKNSHLLYIK